MNDVPTIRTLIALCETRNRGMNAVKAALNQRLDADSETDAEISVIDQWGIMDDLWITASGGLMLFRELRLKQPWDKTLRRTGHTFWSTSSGGASPYDADALDLRGTVDVKIVAELPVTANVDWDDLWATILRLHHVGEDELRLHEVRLIIRHISIAGQDVKSSWIGKTLIS